LEIAGTSAARRRHRVAGAAVACAAVVLLVAGLAVSRGGGGVRAGDAPAGAQAGGPRGGPGPRAGVPARAVQRDAGPLGAWRLYRDPSATAVREEARLRTEGDFADARLLGRIAGQPVADWFAADSPDLTASVAAVVDAAARRHRLPVLVAYEIPHRDCGGYAGGGAPSGAAYISWIQRFAAGIGARPAVVIVEPDAVSQTLQGCLSPTAISERYALLASAVGILRHRTDARIYVDAGNPGFHLDVSRLVLALKRADVLHAAGFSVNVSNFQTTRASIAFAMRLSRRLGHAHFVIDTSRNGNGPDTDPADRPTWCNPPGRALGHRPTTVTGQPLLDAYLWVKPPGNSDGACRSGAPPAGHWWMSYALALAAASGS
jgi:endoglucanase